MESVMISLRSLLKGCNIHFGGKGVNRPFAIFTISVRDTLVNFKNLSKTSLTAIQLKFLKDNDVMSLTMKATSIGQSLQVTKMFFLINIILLQNVQ